MIVAGGGRGGDRWAGGGRWAACVVGRRFDWGPNATVRWAGDDQQATCNGLAEPSLIEPTPTTAWVTWSSLVLAKICARRFMGKDFMWTNIGVYKYV